MSTKSTTFLINESVWLVDFVENAAKICKIDRHRFRRQTKALFDGEEKGKSRRITEEDEYKFTVFQKDLRMEDEAHRQNFSARRITISNKVDILPTPSRAISRRYWTVARETVERQRPRLSQLYTFCNVADGNVEDVD